ncbi:MFS transporter [Methyloceanibacter sp.]|uniref:MFS transporter n=1 Tax=Methyloceanibacter sp. TaxID=1965321 RepID=UPI003569E94E
MANHATSSPSLAWRLGFLYAALFLVIGCYLPYMPVWLSWRTLSADQIAILLATPLYIRIVFTPVISFVADLLGNRRGIVIALAWGSLGSFALLWVSDGFWQMMLAIALLAVNWTTIMPLVETIAISGIRKSGLDYGRVRLWGSLTFIGASLAAGIVIQFRDAGTVLPMLMTATALLIFAAYLVPRDVEPKRQGSPVRRLRLRHAFALARAPLFLLFLLAAAMIQGSHALLYAFGSLHWRAQGFSGGTIGALWSIGVIAEVALFAVSGRLVSYVGSTRLMVLAGGAAVVRWAVLALDPPLLATGLVQTLHALSFGATHLAAIHFLTHAVPEDRSATAQGLYAAVVAGLVLGSVTIACGPLYEAYGGQAYAAMVLLAGIGTAAAALLGCHWQGGLVVGDQPHSAGKGVKTMPSR